MIEKEWLGYWYAIGWTAALLGLLSNYPGFMVAGIVILGFAWYSDRDEDNHVDPPGTAYMDRDGRPVSSGEHDTV